VSAAEREELRCPSCRAPLPESAARGAATCPFCGAASAPAAPKVVERVVERVVVVAQPGSAGATSAGARAMPCPRCAQSLFEGRAGDVAVHGCGACGGIWLDNEGSRRITERRDARIVELAERASRHATAKPETHASGIPCPVCASAMTRVRARRAAIELDVCAAHGTWFDDHELALVARAYAQPLPGRGIPSEAELQRIVASTPNGGDAEIYRRGAAEVLPALGAILCVAIGAIGEASKS